MADREEKEKLHPPPRPQRTPAPHCYECAFMVFVCLSLSALVVLSGPFYVSVYSHKAELDVALSESSKVVTGLSLRRERFLTDVDKMLTMFENATDANGVNVLAVRDSLVALAEFSQSAQIQELIQALFKFLVTDGPAIQQAANELGQALHAATRLAGAVTSSMAERP